jgi:hypothetical protein
MNHERDIRILGLAMLTTLPLWLGGEILLPIAFWSAVVIVPALGALRGSSADIAFRMPRPVPVQRRA